MLLPRLDGRGRERTEFILLDATAIVQVATFVQPVQVGKNGSCILVPLANDKKKKESAGSSGKRVVAGECGGESKHDE